jgi:integrase
MAKLTYYLRGAGDDKTKKTVVIRFQHNGNFDRATKAKVALKDFDADTGMVKLKVAGAAEENKKIDQVRSRFLEVLSWIQTDNLKYNEENQRELTVDFFKATYLELERHLEVTGKDSFQHTAQLSRNAIADDLYLEIARLEGELDVARGKLNRILYPNWDERLLSNAFELYITASREDPLSVSTKKNYGVTQRLMERSYPGLHVDELTKKQLEDMRDAWVKAGKANSSLNEHFIRLKAVLKHFAENVDPSLNLSALGKVKAGKIVFDKRVIFLNAEELDDLDKLVLDKPRDQYIRDFFLLSCFTGLRHVDLHFSENKITPSKQIQIFAKKTKSVFSVPYIKHAQAIMERLKANPYREEYEKQWVGNFSEEVKQICKQIPSMLKEEAVTVQENSPEKPRWKLISSKAGRKTFINICMLAGVSIDTVAHWVGHTTVEMIHKHYKDHNAIGEKEREKLNKGFQRIE